MAEQQLPVVVSGGALTDKTVVSIATGATHTCAVTAEGLVACWGDNSSGQLGDGSTTDSSVPVLAVGGPLDTATVQRVVTGGQHTCDVGHERLGRGTQNG